jgi:hypothetical protein
VNAPKQIRTASVTSVRATAQLYEQNIFRRIWEKRQNKSLKGTGSPTLVNYSRRSSVSSADLDPSVTIIDYSSDPGSYPDGLPLATSTPHTMSSSSSSIKQISQAAGSLLGVGIPGVNPLPVEAPLPQRLSPRRSVKKDLSTVLTDTSTQGAAGGMETEKTPIDSQDSVMEDSQPDPGVTASTLDVTVVSTASDWPDNVIFDSTRPNASLPEHLQLSGGVPLPPIDSIRPIITARRNLPPGLSPKPAHPSPLGSKRNVPFGSPLKSAKSEGGSLSEMDSSDGAQKQVQMTVRKKKKRHPAPIDSAMYQALVDQLDSTTLEAQRNQNKTIEALDQAMTEIRALRAQVESLQVSQGSLAGNLDLTTSRVATCEITLHQHGQQLQEVQNRQATMTSQWDAFQQKWKDGAIGTGNQQQEAGHLTDFFLGGIPQLRQAIGLPPHSDPVEVVATMLKTLSLYCSVDRIFVADNAAQNRTEARAVVLRMRSSFHKRDTMVKVKQFLATRQVRDATVRDCFPSAAMEVARNLNRYGGHLRRNQGYQRYRVIADRDGHPILQVAKQGTGYQDYTVTQAEMAAFLKDLSPANATQQRSSTRGKTGPGHRAKKQTCPGHSSLCSQ